MKRWQLISRNPRGLFDILKDPSAETWLSTVELPMIGRELGIDIPEKYETCYFDENKESEILEVYNTQEAAIAGHPLFLTIIISLISVVFGLIIISFIVASVMDLIDYRCRKKDLFYQLSREHNRMKRPARK